jgi:hypothetical protein
MSLPKLLDRVRTVVRVKHFSHKTENVIQTSYREEMELRWWLTLKSSPHDLLLPFAFAYGISCVQRDVHRLPRSFFGIQDNLKFRSA